VSEKFVHESEAFIASIFDYHDVKWEYEPNTLVLSTDANGLIRRAFTPDFYLPEFDTYVEVTVMRKPGKKRRKIEMAIKNFPGINIILLCRDDIKILAEEYKYLLNTCAEESFVL
jgi:hypothetical protein